MTRRWLALALVLALPYIVAAVRRSDPTPR